jgi:hypothetical protein
MRVISCQLRQDPDSTVKVTSGYPASPRNITSLHFRSARSGVDGLVAGGGTGLVPYVMIDSLIITPAAA